MYIMKSFTLHNALPSFSKLECTRKYKNAYNEHILKFAKKDIIR